MTVQALRAFSFIGLLIVLSLSACSKKPVKTESMLKFEKAVSEQQALIDEANEILDGKVGDNPISNIAQLVYAKELTVAAEQVFVKANIVGVKQDEIRALKERIDAYQPALANHALDLLYQFTDQSDGLRAKLDEISNLPFVEGKQESNFNAAVFHRDAYNKVVVECCLNPLLQLEPMLTSVSNGNYLALRRLILNANSQQALIARDAKLSDSFRNTLDELTSAINQ